MKKIIFVTAALLIAANLWAQRISRQEYIVKYEKLAIEQMEKYGIPASIKMAQALLESDNGNSRLAREGNNHFGIKCKGNNWTGETMTHDDDAQGECFRKYTSAEQSFIDHSEFLDNSPRYDFLFSLGDKDYKAWANGLKQAGYATNPAYPEMLIKIIEDNQLYRLDEGVSLAYKDIPAEDTSPRAEQEVRESIATGETINVDNYSVTLDKGTGRQLYYNNGIPYIIAEDGDTFESLATALRIPVKRLLKYNDFLSSPVKLQAGNALYIKMKNKRSENGYTLHVVGADETMHSISQKYGIRLSNLYNINNMSHSDSVRVGQQIRVR